MKLNEKQFKEIAEAIAESSELKGTVQVDVDEQSYAYLNCKYEKGAEVDVECETGACNVYGAWCNIYRIELVDDENGNSNVDCDIEALESKVAEYMNN